MKFNLNTEIFNDKTLKMIARAQLPAPQPVVLSALLMSMLVTGMADERAPADVKAKRYALLCKLSAGVDDGGSIDLTVDELGLISALADSNCPTLIHGRLKEILNAPEAA